MTIDQSALAHIMSVLTELYSDPELAVIREYSTNALDSHVEAGVKRPIEISLPTPLSPYFTVQDFGVGLDADGIREIYSRYGASTKRDSDDAVGMLGLGCKSALAYTEAFILTGVKNGTAIQVSVSRSADGGGEMKIVSEYETDESNGVTVQVPVKGWNEFAQKAANFFRFWKPGTVLVNGEEPKKLEGTWIADDILMSHDVVTGNDYYRNSNDYIVMGNVPYPLENIRLNSYGNGFGTVAFVEIGEVHFTPSREALMMTAQTEAKIEEIQKRVQKERDDAATKAIESAPSAYEALQETLKARKIGFRGNVEWNGKTMPDEFKMPNNKKMTLVRVEPGYGVGGWGEEYRIDVLTANSRVHWMVGYTDDKMTGFKRKKLLQWAEKNGVTTSLFALVDKLPKEFKPWIDPDKIHDWSGPASEKLTRNKTNRNGKPSGSYDAVTVDNGVGTSVTILADDIDLSKPVYYAIQNDLISHTDLAFVKEAVKNLTIINLSKNRVNKFLRDFPQAINLKGFALNEAKEWFKNLTDDERRYLANKDTNLFRVVKSLDKERIECPVIQKWIDAANPDFDANKLRRQHDKYRYLLDFSRNIETTKELEEYPLLLTVTSGYGTISKEMVEHMHLYINAAYAAKGDN